VLVIYSAQDTIYILFIFSFGSVTSVNIKEMRISQPTSPKLRTRDED
jgi:hypothetical protein